MPPTQYLEFRDSPGSPGSQWYAWHLGWDSSFAHARPLAFLPPLHTLNASHGVKQKCFQGFPNFLLGWAVRSHLQKKMFQQPLFIMSAPHPCSTSVHERLSIITPVEHQHGGDTPGSLWSFVLQLCDDTPIPALRMGWNLS